LKDKQQFEKDISDLVGVFTDPIIVFPGGWGDTLPEWLKNAITLERLEINIKALKGEKMTGTDAEACAYLYTAGLTQPMNSDWTQIYLYVASKTHTRWRKGEVPEDIRVETLGDYEMAQLNHLKDWLYNQRTRARKEHDKEERRQAKEKAAERQRQEQPALFDF